MTTTTANDALAVVYSRVRAKTGKLYPGIEALYKEAHLLWDDEFESWKALHAARLYDAAECAWQRRTAAENLTCIFVTAL